jgi:hypothetical protein
MENKKFNLVNLYNRSIKIEALANYIYQLYLAQHNEEITIPSDSWATISVKLTYLTGKCDDWYFNQVLQELEDLLNNLGV